MAKQAEVLEPIQAASVNLDQPANISTGQLLELLAKMSESQSNKLAEAIILAQKPYVDPRKEIDEENARIQAREQMRRQKEDQKYSQSVCPHVAGSNALSELPDTAGRTSIVWHRFDVGDELGICTNCTRIFTPADPDYAQWRMKKSYNRMSRSGDRQFRDPIAAQKAARQ